MLSVKKAVRAYNANSLHRCVLLGFAYKGREYVYLTKHIPASWCYWNMNRGAYRLRMSITDRTKRKLIKKACCECIGLTAELFNDSSKYNKGDQFECYLYERLTGTPWRKDCTPWDEGADIETSVYSIQVKRENSSITSLKMIEKYN